MAIGTSWATLLTTKTFKPTGGVIIPISMTMTATTPNQMGSKLRPVIMRASDFGMSGHESRDELEADTDLKARLESIRLKAGPMMRLDDVREKSVPKMTLVSKALCGGAINTRSFIPHRCHATIGVFAAVSVATACLLDGSPAHALAVVPGDGRFSIEHPGGAAEVLIEQGDDGGIKGAGTLRTARKLMDGRVFP